MRRIFLISLILCLFSQSNASSDFGLKMGMISSKFELKFLSSDRINYATHFDQNRIGPTMGVYYRFFDFEFINFESELYYIQKGGQEEIDINVRRGDFNISDIQFDYLQMQINMRPNYQINEINVYGIIGASLDYLLSVKNGLNPREDFEDFSISYSIGAGIELNVIHDHSLFLEFFVSSDITNIYKDSDTEFKFQIYMIRLGFGILK